MAGKFPKALIYQPRVWMRHVPDWKFIKTFYHYFITHQRDNKDDTLLGVLTDAFAADGITFHPATDFAPELLVKSGQIAGRPPSFGQQADIEFGWDVAKLIGRLDIGQSICVKDRAVLAVEAIEGTDACILRAGELCKSACGKAAPRRSCRLHGLPALAVAGLHEGHWPLIPPHHTAKRCTGSNLGSGKTNRWTAVCD